MTVRPVDVGPVRARIAVAVVFFTTGALLGTWVPRVPAIKDQVHAGTGPFGVALLGLAVSAIFSKQICGQMVPKFGSASLIRVGIVLSCLTLPLPALAGDVAGLGLALFAFGLALGFLDVAMNAHAVAVQQRLGRSVMSSFHGLYSVGGLSATVAGGRVAGLDISPLTHFSVAAIVLGCGSLLASCRLLPSTTDTAPRRAEHGNWTQLPRDRRLPLIILGFVGLCGMVGEGAAGDWGAIYLRDDLGAGASLAASGYAAYSLSMATMRLLGDRIIRRWGELRVITCSATFAGTGFAVALVIGHAAAAVCGFAILGIGLSVVIPVVFSIAGRLGGEMSGPSISIVSTITGTGFLAGPPIIGFLAEAVGLPGALAVVSILAFLAAGLVRVAARMTTPVPIGAES